LSSSLLLPSFTGFTWSTQDVGIEGLEKAGPCNISATHQQHNAAVKQPDLLRCCLPTLS